MPEVVESTRLSIVKKKETSDAFEAGNWIRVFTTKGVHPFDEVKWKRVDAILKDSDGEIKFEQKGVEVPDWWNHNSTNIVASKYMRVIKGIKENSVKQIFTRVVDVLTTWANDQGYFNTNEDAEIYKHELVYVLLHQFGAFNSPVWFNLGVPDRKQAASACFISQVEDTLDSIMDYSKAEVKIFSAGSGSGANLSSLRSSYEKLSTGSFVAGPISWMRGLNENAGSMKSGGSTRNAAKMVVLDINHPDILKTHDERPGFIRCKAVEEKKAHDLILKCGYSADFDDPNGAYKQVMYQNANHSVSISDDFMHAVENDEVWHTRAQDGEIVHSYKAKDLWKEIADAAWVCADPGLQFSSHINKWHTTPQSGPIRSSNPCSEFLHVDNTACNLCAINLTKFFDGLKFNWDRFRHTVRTFVTAQNAIIAKAVYPTDEITLNSHKLRPIGLNYGDLGALIMKLGYGYDSDEGRAIAARMASLMTGCAYLTSAKLASRSGAFSEFESNKDSMLGIMKMHREANMDVLARWDLKEDPIGDDVVSISKSVWEEAIRLGQIYGYTISQASLQAPLGTISFLMGMNTTGVEPAFSLVSYKTLVGGGSMKIVNDSVKSGLSALGYQDDQIGAICDHIEEKDSIEGAPDLKDEHLPVFDCAMPSGDSERFLTPMAHIKMLAAIQPLITCAQSKTVNLPYETTADEIADVYFQSWKLGVKCVSVYRDGCKLSQPLSSKEKDDRFEIAEESVEQAPVRVVGSTSQRRHMPEDVTGSRHRFEINGYKGYIIMNDYPNGDLGEVFLKLGKPGSTVAGLIDGFTQQLSIALQYGVPIEKLIASFVDTRFEPSGFTRNPNIRFAKSLYDYLFKVLDLKYCKGEVTGIGQKSEPGNMQEEISRDVTSLPPPKMSIKKSFDGPPCTNCGMITVRNGSCYLCSNCGSTTGCS